MTLSRDDLVPLVSSCASLVHGARIEAVHQSSPSTLILTLHRSGAGRSFLLFETHAELARWHLVAERPRALPSPPVFCQVARKHLVACHNVGIRALPERGAVELEFARPREDVTWILRWQLRGRSARLSLRRTTDDKPVQELTPSGALELSCASQGGVAAATADEELPQIHGEMASHYGGGDGEALRVRAAQIAKEITKALQRRRRLLAKIEAEVKIHEHRLGDREKGELLKSALGKIRRGQTSVEVQDFYDSELSTVSIELDPKLSPQANVERLFKRYRKAQRGLPIAQARRDKVAAELDVLAELHNVAGQVEDLSALESIEERCRELIPRRRQQQRGPTPPGETRPSAPRQFLSFDGFEILAGRSARENDRLTFHIAHGNDLFLHVSGRAGAHVIVRVPSGKTVPSETLIDAAQLALYFSLSPTARQTASHGGAGEVDYAPVKHVRKPKGAPPGLVLLATYKTIRVRLEIERLNRLMKKTL